MKFKPFQLPPCHQLVPAQADRPKVGTGIKAEITPRLPSEPRFQYYPIIAPVETVMTKQRARLSVSGGTFKVNWQSRLRAKD